MALRTGRLNHVGNHCGAAAVSRNYAQPLQSTGRHGLQPRSARQPGGVKFEGEESSFCEQKEAKKL
jgi:hypothetical protein